MYTWNVVTHNRGTGRYWWNFVLEKVESRWRKTLIQNLIHLMSLRDITENKNFPWIFNSLYLLNRAESEKMLGKKHSSYLRNLQLKYTFMSNTHPVYLDCRGHWHGFSLIKFNIWLYDKEFISVQLSCLEISN